MNCIENLSIIIPVGPKEEAWRTLLADLSVPNVKWLKSSTGRAKQLNAGARAAQRSNLWFVHADSRISPQAFASLKRSRVE